MIKNKFLSELTELINKYSKENESNTPDFILANYICDCLLSYSKAIESRDRWYNFKPFDERTTTNTK